MKEISWLDKRLLDFQEGFFYINLFNCKKSEYHKTKQNIKNILTKQNELI